MQIEDNTNQKTNPYIWVESDDIEINIEKDIVEIKYHFDGAWERGSGRMEIERNKLIELLSRMDGV